MLETNQNFDLTRIVQAIIMLLAASALLLLVWSLPRGLDISDESFYLLNYRYPVEYNASFTDFHLLIARVFGITNAPILAYRGLSVLAIIIGGMSFGMSLSAWLRSIVPKSPLYWLTKPGLAVALILLGELLAISIAPRTLSYNSINTFLLLIMATALLAALRQKHINSNWLLLVGIAIGLDFFVKISTAIILFGSTFLLLGWCWRRAGIKKLAQASMLIMLGIGMGMGVYFLRAQTPEVWWKTLIQEMTMIRSQGQGYNSKDLLVTYLQSAISALKVIVWPLGLAILPVGGLLWWWPRRGRQLAWHMPLALSLLSIAGLWLGWQAVKHLWYSTAYINHQETISVLLALLFLAVLATVSELKLGRKQESDESESSAESADQRWPVALWLLLLPALAAAGTANDLRLNLLMDAAPWFGLLLIVLSWPRPASRLPFWTNTLLLLLPVCFVTEQVVWGVMRVPYLLTGAMTTQNVPLTAKGLRGPLLLDQSTVNFINQLEELLRKGGFKPGDPLLAFYDMPGFVYLCGGVSPGAPWYFSDIADERTCHALSITSLPVKQACILLNEPLGPVLKECMQRRGLNFPDGYRLVGELKNPYQINTYMYRADQKVVQVYAPLRK